MYYWNPGKDSTNYWESEINDIAGLPPLPRPRLLKGHKIYNRFMCMCRVCLCEGEGKLTPQTRLPINISPLLLSWSRLDFSWSNEQQATLDLWCKLKDFFKSYLREIQENYVALIFPKARVKYRQKTRRRHDL